MPEYECELKFETKRALTEGEKDNIRKRLLAVSSDTFWLNFVRASVVGPDEVVSHRESSEISRKDPVLLLIIAVVFICWAEAILTLAFP